MGESRKRPLRVEFDKSVKLEFHGARVSSDAGLLLHRELDEMLGLTEQTGTSLTDMRTGKNTQHTLTALLRQSVYGRLAGYEDVNDAERLRFDPVMRQIVGGRADWQPAASTSEMSRFETQMLTKPENLTALTDMSGQWIDQVNSRVGMKKLILDMDSSESPTYGKQDGSAFNGHFGCTCYHPLFCFNQFGDLERANLRKGNVHSADDWLSVLQPIVARYRERPLKRFFRGDAAFANPDLYCYLEQENFSCAIRLKSNTILQKHIAPLLTRPVGRPSRAPKVFYASFPYQAASWQRARRVVAKVEWHAGELFARVGFIVTNLNWPPKKVVKFYNHRGTAEQWIKEGKHAIHWTRLSCHDFSDNAVRLQLFGLAYNLGNFMRRLILPPKVKHWMLSSLREKLIKIGAKVIHHAKYITFQMAEVAIPREMFRTMLKRVERLRLAPDTG